jgi:hypothetical protein
MNVHDLRPKNEMPPERSETGAIHPIKEDLPGELDRALPFLLLLVGTKKVFDHIQQTFAIIWNLDRAFFLAT